MDLEPIDAGELEADELGEAPAYELLASAGDVSAHIFLDQEDLSWLLHEIEQAEAFAGARPGAPWEPQLPLMRGFFFHPRLRVVGGEVLAPGQLDEEGEPIEFWEIRIDDEDGSQVILRLSESVLRGILRQLRDALAKSL
ncbi:MAG: hypothetical protein ACR2PL_18225 [Dehalococcoidia bacterium]